MIDLKSSSTKELLDTQTAAAQLSFYGIAYPSAHFEVIILAKTLKPVISVQIIDPWPHQQLVRFYREILAAMRAGIHYAIRGWQCQSCPFRDRCRGDG